MAGHDLPDSVVDQHGPLGRDLEQLTVPDKRIAFCINGKVAMDYTEPENVQPPKGWDRRLSSGTFAIQAHDPDGKVYYRNTRVKPLPG